MPMCLWTCRKILTRRLFQINPSFMRYFSLSSKMAKSRFDYVKKFELDDKCLPNCWMVVRVDGKGFHKFSDVHGFEKPNDTRALNLMTKCADHVMKEFNDIIIAYGQSDEYSFVFRKETTLFNRRASKIESNVCSLFTSSFVYFWPLYFNDVKLQYPPSFDGRVVLYPTTQNLRDYLSWRQADCHINNLYNTVFWALVNQGGLTTTQAQQRLKGTLSSDKNEILFSEFGINYNNLPELFRKGTTLIREKNEASVELQAKCDVDQHQALLEFKQFNEDIIRDDFWKAHPQLLSGE